MRSFVDLHSHFVVGIDDGSKDMAESEALLRALFRAGFGLVVGTPHMRPGMFDNTADDLRRAFEATRTPLGLRRGHGSERGLAEANAATDGLPEVLLASEHFFDDIVFQRLLGGDALPYPGGHAALIEVSPRAFPLRLPQRFADLTRRGLRPVLAHPERYAPVWKEPECLEPLLDVGALALLDVAALAGRYGRTPERTARALLEAGYYYAACSDAHHADEVPLVERGIDALFELAGEEEALLMLRDRPLGVLLGRLDL